MRSLPIQIVAATRLDAEAFLRHSRLGRSLRQPQHRGLEPLITMANRAPLAVAYNAAIAAAAAETVLVFCHDAVDLGPDPLAPQLEAALARFDLVRLASKPHRQDGLVPVEQRVGVVLAARAGVLQTSGVRFDPAVPVHAQGLDACRKACQRGLRLGTWPVLHASHADAVTPSGLEAVERDPRPWNAPDHSPESDRYRRFRQARQQERAGRWPEAESLYRQLLAEQPQHGGLLLRLAAVQQRQGQHDDALASLEAALAIDPRLARAHAERGALLLLAGDHDGAAAALRRALVLEPSLSRAANNLLLLARQLQAIGRLAAAVEAQRAVLRAAPTRADMLLELGSSLMLQGKVEAARACFARLLRHHPHHPGARFQMALALESLGEVEAALTLHQQALAETPESAEVRLALELVRLHGCDWDDYEARIEQLHTCLEACLERADAPALSPLRALYFPLPLSLLRRISERWSAAQGRSAVRAATDTSPALPRAAKPAPLARSGRLRLGYLSADFRDHAMGSLIHGLFRHHDRERFEVFAYAINDLSDGFTRSVQRRVEHFCVVAGDTDAQLAERIRADRLDVLIDLMGHTHHGRPGVLAQRPAPLQLHYLGFPGPLGCSYIDGVIADAWLIPPEHHQEYGRQVLRLPWGFVSSPLPADLEPPAAAAPPAPPLSRASLGLTPEQVVLACFNRPEKIDPGSFQRWLAVLQAVPEAVLLLVIEAPRTRERLRQRAAAAGLQPARLVFTSSVPSHSLPALCRQADLLLDTALYGVGATGVAALAAGLPLLTCPGESFAARMGASLCAAAGLEELICPTPESYTAKAIALARQPERLRQLSEQLRQHHEQLPLFNTAGWVAQLETLLEAQLAR